MSGEENLSLTDYQVTHIPENTLEMNGLSLGILITKQTINYLSYNFK
jgi:hypothetical protein